MTVSDTSRRPPRPTWLVPSVAASIGVMAAISLGVYLGLVARGPAWPLFVLAVASAPLALLAVARVVQAVFSMGQRTANRKGAKTQRET